MRYWYNSGSEEEGSRFHWRWIAWCGQELSERARDGQCERIHSKHELKSIQVDEW